ncbi:aldo/keto reductase [Carboxylicivirga sediminis]|uniref:Aldo/keto reductase n=1 Tax=Carboxylicivirga sediminis TaxID=2006564 RepID=A0A941J062_9BACT|nr:aldo/keto reductase [Carboxylicivirga sediminis]MBR8537943.1 aldo/keto reductase [Carboxylicivirga sediminis]
MEYRRFGKTNKHISVITLGGMRFKQVWDNPRQTIPTATQDHCNQMVDLAIKQGINHFETAYGYVKSETVFGRTLNKELNIERSSYHLMTKGNPMTADETRRLVEEQLNTLQTDYFDFYAWHGINTNELLYKACLPGGAVDELLKMKEEGIIKHVGFSTHGSLETIVKAIETDLFEFVNLHYYYYYQRNHAAVQLAKTKDMGVFIISPNDKGGQLYNAPAKVREAIPHATPIQWNARFCLSHPEIHTLSFGMTEASHFDEMNGIFPSHIPLNQSDMDSKTQLDRMVKDDPYAHFDGYDLKHNSDLDIPLLLHWRKLWKCYDLLNFARYRYKELKTPNHWVPGVFATPDAINKLDFSQVPEYIPLKEMLYELHEAFYEAPQQLKVII